MQQENKIEKRISAENPAKRPRPGTHTSFEYLIA